MELWGTPAKVIDTIQVEEKDQASIDKYGEELYEINNEYIQTETDAISRALIILRDYAEYGSSLQIDVKGTPALQNSDLVTLALDGYTGNYSVQKITNILGGNQFLQRLKVKKKQLVDLFILDESVLDGTSLLAP
jgi:hypothetical protein